MNAPLTMSCSRRNGDGFGLGGERLRDGLRRGERLLRERFPWVELRGEFFPRDEFRIVRGGLLFLLFLLVRQYWRFGPDAYEQLSMLSQARRSTMRGRRTQWLGIAGGFPNDTDKKKKQERCDD